MSSSSFYEKKIDDLIWGSLLSEIIETKFSLCAATEIINSAKVYPVTLLVGFLDFIHYKCGLMPQPNDDEKEAFEEIDHNFDDHSSWVKYLMTVDDVDLDNSYFSRQFVDQNDNKHETSVLLDTFSFFECGMILNKTKLIDESRYSFVKILREFHIDGKKTHKMLSYFKQARNTHKHTLVLRPTRLAWILYRLDDELKTLTNCPNQVLRIEEWEKATDIPEKEYRMVNVQRHETDCSEENFHELVKTLLTEIPTNVQFMTFYEYIRDKLTLESAKEWEDIRDRYIAESKKVLKCATSDITKVNLDSAKTLLAKAREEIEEKKYIESVILSCKSMEKVLNEIIKQDMPLSEKIDTVTIDYFDLREYREGLHFIRTTRDALVYTNEVYECDIIDAKFARDKMDQFLAGIMRSLHS